MARSYALANPRRSSPEKAEERSAMKLMSTVGFSCWHLSQSRATNQTPGWPDALFTHAARRLSVWYEAKSSTGKQSEAQKRFQAEIEACGHEYVVGTHDKLIAWLKAKGVVR